ncbi:MAG: NUDIX domain-containing protein [Planctomycetota bacterium]|nr:MAG: NUDIX domain-containing protein [Planctomycetota bacterium]
MEWARKLLIMAENGLHFSQDPFDQGRYQELQGIAQQMMASLGKGTPTQVETFFRGDGGYPTPKLGVRAAVFREDKILLVRETSDGLWTLPGGWCDVGDSPRQATERELWEETGFRGVAEKLLAVFDQRLHPHPPYPFHVIKMFFRCRITGGEATPSHETSEIEFFGLDELPELSPLRVVRNQLETVFAHRTDPDRPTDFD